jgi:hypothetical protein
MNNGMGNLLVMTELLLRPPYSRIERGAKRTARAKEA